MDISRRMNNAHQNKSKFTKIFLNNNIIMIILSNQINTFLIANTSNNINKQVIYFTLDITLSKTKSYPSQK